MSLSYPFETFARAATLPLTPQLAAKIFHNKKIIALLCTMSMSLLWLFIDNPSPIHVLAQEITSTITPAPPSFGEYKLSIFTPKIIDGVETYGSDRPLTADELKTLVTILNDKTTRGEVEINPNEFYGIWLVRPKTYTEFEKENGETFQKYAKRVYDVQTTMIKNGNSFIPNGKDHIKGVKLRCIIQVTEDADPSGSWNTSYLENGPTKYADGWWGFWGDEPRQPRNDSWWSDEFNVSMADVHELGHVVRHLSDDYGLDSVFTSEGQTEYLLTLVKTSPDAKNKLAKILNVKTNEVETTLKKRQTKIMQTQTTQSSALNNVSSQWREYITNRRTDSDGANIMNLPSSAKESSYAMWMYARRIRQGVFHSLESTIPESTAYQYEIAPHNVLNLGTQYNGAKISVYRTDGDYINRTLTPIKTGLVEKGEFDLGDPFNNALEEVEGRMLIPDYKGVLFIRVDKKGTNGTNPEFAWTDIRIFNEAFEKTGRTIGVVYNMSLANNTMSYEEYNWASQLDVEPL